MNAVKNNPYRTLGLLGNSSEKELQKQIATIKRFAEVGKTKAFEYDFPFFGEVVRSTEKVQEAASKIEQAKNKVHYALFWFLNSGHIDEAALNNLKDGHIEKATEIWKKTLKDSAVTVKNFASISNLSTLQLGIITYNGSFDPEEFSAAIDLKGRLLLSDVFNNFVTTVIGEGISINRDIVLKEFADEILQIVKPYLNKPNGIKSIQLVNAFCAFPDDIRKYISDKFVEGPLSNLESKIGIAKNKRKQTPKDSEVLGEELYNSTKDELNTLKTIIGSDSVQYQIIVNKLANEILQCAIDFFIEYRDNASFDPGETAMLVLKMAEAVKPTGQTKSRLLENINNLQEWIDDKENRIKEKKIRREIAYIESKIEQLDEKSESFHYLKTFISECSAALVKIRNVIGESNDKYINISTNVVHNALNLLINIVNTSIERHQKTSAILLAISNRTININGHIEAALKISFLLSEFHMHYDFKAHFNENFIALKSIADQLGICTLSPKEKIEKEIRDAESELTFMHSKTFFKEEIDAAYNELTIINGTQFLKNEYDAAINKLDRIKRWRFLRSQVERESEIKKQQDYINQIQQRAEKEKLSKVIEQQTIINQLLKKSEERKENRLNEQQDKISNLKSKLKEISLWEKYFLP
jgi:hypothetical protein